MASHRKVVLDFDQLVSLRTFLIAVVFEFFDSIELETICGIYGSDVLQLSHRLDRLFDYRREKFCIEFSEDEAVVVIECLNFGINAFNIYGRHKSTIDYKTCHFGDLAPYLRDALGRST